MGIKSVKKVLISTTKSEGLAGGIFWNFLGNILARTSNLLVSIFVAYYLSKEEYGQLGFLRSTLSTFVIFGTFGFGIAATKFFADKQYEGKGHLYGLTIRFFSSLMSIVFSLLLFFFSEKVAINMGGGRDLDIPLKITSISLFFLSLNSVQTGILVGLKQFKNTAKALSISSFCSALVAILLTKYYKLEGYAVGMAIGALVNWIICLKYLPKITFSWKREKHMFSEITRDVLKISVPAILSGIVVMPLTWYSNAIIIDTSNGLVSLGTYNAVYNITAITLAVINILGQAILPFAVEKFSAKDTRFELINYYVPWFIGTVLSLPLIFVPEIVFYIYSFKYSGNDVYVVSILIALSTILISQRQGIAKNFLASGKMWISLWGNLLWGVCLIASLYFLKSFAAIGYAASFFFAYLINTIVFVPIYVRLGLIEKKLIYSKTGLFISVLVVLAVIISVYGNIYIRILSLIISLGLMYKIIRRVFSYEDKITV